MSEYLPEPKSLAGRAKVELDLFNHATKEDLKNATGVDTSKFAKKDVGKLVPVPVDLNKLSDVVKMMLLKRI